MYKKIISIVVVLAIVFTGGYLTAKQLVPDSAQVAAGPRFSTKKVERGDIVQGVNITGQLNGNWGGSIAAPKPEGVTDAGGSPVNVTYTVEEVFVSPNQMIKKGDNLVRLSASNLGDIMENLTDSIQKKQEDIQRINEGVNSKLESLSRDVNREITNVDNVNPREGIVITAPIKGRVTEMTLSEGEELKGSIAKIVDDSKLKIPFKVTQIEYPNIKVGDTVLIMFMRGVNLGTEEKPNIQYYPAVDGYCKGTITSLNSNAVPNSDQISYVHNGMIEAVNPGLIQPGMKAMLYRQSNGSPVEGFRYDSTVKSYTNEKSVVYTSSLENIVATEILVNNNDFVEKGQTLIRIAGNDVEKSIQTKIDEINGEYKKIEDINREIEAIYKKIDKVSELTSKLMVTAPADGMVSYVNYEVGATIQASDSSDQWSLQLMDMYNTNEMYIYTTVSDLDVLYIRQDALVDVTVDALPGEKFEGQVMGFDQYTNREGKTVYNVQIKVEGREGLRPGMNTNCFVNSGEATDTLLVPIEAVFEENGKQKVEILNEAEEAEAVEIEVGLMNDMYVEVLSGLEEGQLVVTGSTKDLMPSQSVPENDALLPSADQSDTDQ
ncbi:MAG TPA: hypothetical protein DCM73_10705 [Clostridiales bacterium]|nr:hypothetical protein [Clostridiales bacterium]